MEVVPFKAQHFWSLPVQPAQEYVMDYVAPGEIAGLEKQASFSCVDGGDVFMCYGWVPVYATRAMLWAYISKDAGPKFASLHRIALDLINRLQFRRLEMEVDHGFEQGHRWAKMLGFTCEAPLLKGFRLDGGDSSLYARVRS